MSLVISYLLDDGVETVKTKLNDFDDRRYQVEKEFNVEINQQNANTEFCFFISSNKPISATDFSFEINGVGQLGSDLPTQGENCYTIPFNAANNPITVSFLVSNGLRLSVSQIGVEDANPTRLGLPTLTRSKWDEVAVRKVLKIFAYGGHASDLQIRTWANMPPRLAIAEMLNFQQHNLKLSPLTAGERYSEIASEHGTMAEFYEYIGSPASDLPIEVNERQYLGIDGYRFASTFGRMIAVRGLNPFRQKIGFWETNYHLATNRNSGVSRRQMVAYYDAIMSAHEQRVPYHQVMGEAAKSAAVAMQYGHRRSRWVRRWVNGERIYVLEGNHDFAREIHQLFYGIFGANDPNHEEVTIDNTAKMLTDMNVPYIEDFGFDTKVTFETDDHHRDEFGPLNILGQDITGLDAAHKIDNLMPISILHPESLQNLPVYIISTLADDSLNAVKRQQIRSAWAALGPNKDFLTFIHTYATSNMFHASDHIKYLTSFDRAYYLANRFNIDNIEAFKSNDWSGGQVGREIDEVMEGDNASEAFIPLHNVFGGQTSIEASDSAVAFEKNYNRSATQENWQFESELPSLCETCDQGQAWSKDWTKVIPAKNGGYPADHVAQWLWMHVVGSFDNYTDLERSHLLSILGARRLPPVGGEEPWWRLDDRYPFFDLNYLLCIREDRIADGQINNELPDLMAYESWDDYCRPQGGVYFQHELDAFNLSFTGTELATSQNDPFPYLRNLMSQLALVDVGLTDEDDTQRRRANERIHAALAFIFSTPFVFAEGKLQ